MKPTRLFQRFYLLLLVALLVYLMLGMTVRHAWSTLGLAPGTLVLVGLALLISAASYPLARHIGARLDRLGNAVRAFGQGELTRRAVIEGNDEIATLARGFNEAAERIDHLLGVHRQLLANASHELRTPLARIRLGVELLAEHDDPRRRVELVRDLRELDDLLEEILLSSRLDSSLPFSFEADVDVLGVVAEEVARYAEPDVALVLAAHPGSATLVRADPRLLRRAVRNLIENARRHGAAPVRVGVEALDGEVRIVVDDAGQGIDATDRERIFEPFYRSRAHLENVGSGLGLALVRQIARHHGGSIACGEGVLGGACFTVRLPKASAENP